MGTNRYRYFPWALGAVILVILLAGIFIVAAAHESVDEAKARVESRYGFKLDIDRLDTYNSSQKKKMISEVDRLLAKIPQELHEKLVLHFKYQGQEASITLDSRSRIALGHYAPKTITITLYGSADSLLHEYGLMLLHAVTQEYHYEWFEERWSLLTQNLVLSTDIADVFAMFTESYAGGLSERSLNKNPFYERAMFLEGVAELTLNVDGIFIR